MIVYKFQVFLQSINSPLSMEKIYPMAEAYPSEGSMLARPYSLSEQIQRKLAAIDAADAAEHWRHLRLDEDGTVAAWRSYRREMVDPIVAEPGW